MAWIRELKFQPSGKVEEVVTPSGHHYVLPDGRRVEMRQEWVWCFGCNGFSWAERLWSMEQAERDIQKWEDPNSEARKALLKEYKFRDQQQWTVASELRRAYAERDLLLARTTPCHCTRCGSVDFVEVPEGEFTLPDGSGTVTIKTIEHAFVIIVPTCYTPDGYPMSPEAVPPKPPEAKYPQHLEWRDIFAWLVILVTIPIWGPIALLVLLVTGIRRVWDYVRRQQIV